AEPPCRKQIFKITIGILGQHGDTIAFLYALGPQCAREARHPVCELAEARLSTAVARGKMMGLLLQGAVQALGKVRAQNCLLESCRTACEWGKRLESRPLNVNDQTACRVGECAQRDGKCGRVLVGCGPCA